MQYLMFGDIVKVNNSAYVGGNWYWGSRGDCSLLSSYPHMYDFTTSVVRSNNQYSMTSGAVAPFMQGYWTTMAAVGSYIHAEIDGSVWKSSPDSSIDTNNVLISPSTICSFFRGLNTWNSQAILTPIHLDALGSSSLWQYLGYIEHIRFIRIDNYNLGDIITIGSDRWKVFPCVYKDTVARNTPPYQTSYPANPYYYIGLKSSGTLGFAIRYDGP
jgi:hypothetical protein